MAQNINKAALTALLNQVTTDADTGINTYELSKIYFVDTDKQNYVMKLYIKPGQTLNIPAHSSVDGSTTGTNDVAEAPYNHTNTGDGLLVLNFEPGDNVAEYFRLLNNKARLVGVTTGQGNRGAQYDRLVIGDLSYNYLGEFDSVYDLNRHGLFVLHEPNYDGTTSDVNSDGTIAVIKFNNIATIKIGKAAANDPDDSRAVILRLVDNEIIHLDSKEKRRDFMSQFNIWKLTQSHA